jgi:hypothetical protein
MLPSKDAFDFHESNCASIGRHHNEIRYKVPRETRSEVKKDVNGLVPRAHSLRLLKYYLPL